MENQKRMINSDYPDRMRLEWQGTRAFFYGLGYNDADMEKPRVGIMNTWNEINPGHIHQQRLADAVREGIIFRPPVLYLKTPFASGMKFSPGKPKPPTGL